MRAFPSLLGRSSLLRRGRSRSLLLPTVRLGSTGKVPADNRVYGVGINDGPRVLGYRPGTQQLDPDGEIVNGKGDCPYYRKWRDMLRRCYSAALHDEHPTYIGCSVCEEWLTFSQFRAWMVQHDGHWEGMFLSHSVLSRGNKVYSPETCFFVTREMVNLFPDHAGNRGDSPLGVDWHESSGKYRASLQVEGTQKHIGYYDTAAEAHRAWLPHKRAYVLLKIDKHLPAGVPYHARLRDFLIARAHSEYADAEPESAPALAAAAGPSFPPPSLLLSPSSPQQSAPLCTSAEEERPSKQGGAGVEEGGKSAKEIKGRKLVFGMGINDAGYQVKVTTRGPDGKMKTWRCPYHVRWMSMLTRCYSSKYQDRNPTYIGCSVCEDWLTFSKFRAWMVRHDGHWEGTHLSHSVLSRDNKVYSPETCFFVTREIVDLFNEHAGNRGDSPLGVCWDESNGKYRAQLNVEAIRKHIGYYDTEAEAHQAWLPHKRAYVLLKIDKHLPAGVPYHARLRDFLIARAHSEYADVEPAPLAAAAGPLFPPPSPLLSASSPQQSAPLCTSAEGELPSKLGGAGVGKGVKMAKEKEPTLVLGMGINDAGYQVFTTTCGPDGKMTTWRCPYYRKWKDMLERCYSAALHDRHPTYIGCSVCEEWLTFSKFRAWMVQHDGHWEGTYLSHSVLSRGNKVYSPETCFFVTREIVMLFNEHAGNRGDSPLGVYWNASKGKYQALLKVEGTVKFIGRYDTEAEAHRAWLPHKRAYVLLKVDKHLPAGVPYDARLRDFLIARAHSEYADVEPESAPVLAVAAM